MTLLTQEEWTALQRFYAGEPARNIRQGYPGIWGLVARVHEHPDANALIAELIGGVEGELRAQLDDDEEREHSRAMEERIRFLLANPKPQVYGSQWAHSRRQADREKKVT